MRRIDIADTDFNLEEIDSKIIGAGILPFCRTPTGDIQFALGKERFISHWRGSLKWSGFEGGRKANERVAQTAAREFVEESMGIFVDMNKVHLCDIPKLTQQLENNDYAARIVLCIIHAENIERYHVTYLLELPYQPRSIAKFVVERRVLLNMQTKLIHLDNISVEML